MKRFAWLFAIFVFAILGVWFGAAASRALEQKRFTDAIYERGGSVLLSSEPQTAAPMHAIVTAVIGYEAADRIVSVDFFEVSLGDSDFQELSLAEHAPDLIQLSLHGTGVTDAVAPLIADLDELRVLEIGNTGITDSGLRHLIQLNKLEALGLEGLEITEQGLRDVSMLPRLRFLYLSRATVDDSAVAHLSGTSLENLKLDMTAVTGRSTEYISDIQTLEILDLSSTSVDDESLRNLCGLMNIETIFFKDTRVTAEGLLSLVDCTSVRNIAVPAEILKNPKGLRLQELVTVWPVEPEDETVEEEINVPDSPGPPLVDDSGNLIVDDSGNLIYEVR